MQIVSNGENLHECKLSQLETIYMKCQILLSWKNKKKKSTNFSSVEYANSVVKVELYGW